MEPGDVRVRVGSRLRGTGYEELDGIVLSVPRRPELRPSDALLDFHLREFESVERRRSAWHPLFPRCSFAGAA